MSILGYTIVLLVAIFVAYIVGHYQGECYGIRRAVKAFKDAETQSQALMYGVSPVDLEV